MGLFVETNAKNISEYLIASAQKGCNTTLYEGDERRIFIDAVVTPLFVALYNVIDDVAKQKMRKYARGIVLDAIGGVAVPRLEARHAVAVFRFYVEEQHSEDIIIPAGTRISSNDNHYFATDKDVTLKAGELHAIVEGTAVSGGSDYNGLLPGSVAVIVDIIAGIDGAENIFETSGGDDGEPYDTEGDERYRERIALYEDSISTCGTENGYRYFALTADSTVADVNIINPVEVELESEYDVILYVICYGGVLPDEYVIKAITEKCNGTDARPMCEYISVQPAEQVEYDINVMYYVKEEKESKIVNLVEGSGGSVERYVAQQDVAIGQPINPDTLQSMIMNPVDTDGIVMSGVTRCVIESPTYRELAYNQVAKWSGEINIGHKVVD